MIKEMVKCMLELLLAFSSLGEINQLQQVLDMIFVAEFSYVLPIKCPKF